jgi:hypothetical protein
VKLIGWEVGGCRGLPNDPDHLLQSVPGAIAAADVRYMLGVSIFLGDSNCFGRRRLSSMSAIDCFGVLPPGR